jgi:hypothetical protein
MCGRSAFRGFFRSGTRLVGGALGRGVAVDEFDDRHRGHVAIAETGFQDTDIAALTVLVTRAEDREETLDVLVLLEPEAA